MKKEPPASRRFLLGFSVLFGQIRHNGIKGDSAVFEADGEEVSILQKCFCRIDAHTADVFGDRNADFRDFLVDSLAFTFRIQL